MLAAVAFLVDPSCWRDAPGVIWPPTIPSAPVLGWQLAAIARAAYNYDALRYMILIDSAEPVLWCHSKPPESQGWGKAKSVDIIKLDSEVVLP